MNLSVLLGHIYKPEAGPCSSPLQHGLAMSELFLPLVWSRPRGPATDQYGELTPQARLDYLRGHIIKKKLLRIIFWLPGPLVTPSVCDKMCHNINSTRCSPQTTCWTTSWSLTSTCLMAPLWIPVFTEQPSIPSTLNMKVETECYNINHTIFQE